MYHNRKTLHRYEPAFLFLIEISRIERISPVRLADQQKHYFLIINSFFQAKMTKYYLVPASKMWGFSAFLCLMSLFTEYLWVSDCWSEKREQFQDVALDSNCDGIVIVFLFVFFCQEHNRQINRLWNESLVAALKTTKKYDSTERQ